MKSIFVLLIVASISFTASAKVTPSNNQLLLEQAISKTLQADVKIVKIRASLSPLDWYLNIIGISIF